MHPGSASVNPLFAPVSATGMFLCQPQRQTNHGRYSAGFAGCRGVKGLVSPSGKPERWAAVRRSFVALLRAALTALPGTASPKRHLAALPSNTGKP